MPLNHVVFITKIFAGEGFSDWVQSLSQMILHAGKRNRARSFSPFNVLQNAREKQTETFLGKKRGEEKNLQYPPPWENTRDCCHMQAVTTTCQKFLELFFQFEGHLASSLRSLRLLSILAAHPVLVVVTVVPHFVHLLMMAFTLFSWSIFNTQILYVPCNLSAVYSFRCRMKPIVEKRLIFTWG